MDAAEGEKIGKTWSNRHRVRRPRDTIKCLKDPLKGGTTDDPKRMADIAAQYHESAQLQGHDPAEEPVHGGVEEIVGQIWARVSERDGRTLSAEVEEEQVRKAMRDTNREKAPGLDGIPVELWKSMDDQFLESENEEGPNRRCNIIWVLTQVYRDIEEHGMDAGVGLNEGCMTPIYKKKDPDEIANYRPITLLNTDYKILKDRSIFDQVKMAKLVIDYMERTGRRGAVVALDQEKAYDKILHPYLWAVLEKFGFPPKFIRTIQALYEGAETKILINGELSRPIRIVRGVPQGDPLSCLLFDLAIEPLAECIRRTETLKGIQIPTRREHLKIKLFADDTTVVLSEHDRIRDLQRILENWCAVSGAKFNIEKTEIIPLGNPKQRRDIRQGQRLHEGDNMLPDSIHIAEEGEPVRVLGAWLGSGVDQVTTWAPIMEDCGKRLRRWGAVRHSLEGRRLILQMQVAGVTQYLTKVQGMPRSVEEELNRQIRHFTWNHEKADTVNQVQMYAQHEKGGKRILDIEARNEAIHLTWLKAYLNLGEGGPTWAYFADAIIGTDIPPSHRVDEDPESRVMPILQTWDTRVRGSTLPEDLKMMLKAARKHNVRLSATNPSQEVREDLPLWYHAKSAPTAKKMYRTKPAKCLRKAHGIRTVRDTVTLLGGVGENHTGMPNCKIGRAHV